MTRKLRLQVLWATLVAGLLVGAYFIVARNGAPNGSAPASGFFH
jgi:hypothetical protein